MYKFNGQKVLKDVGSQMAAASPLKQAELLNTRKKNNLNLKLDYQICMVKSYIRIFK